MSTYGFSSEPALEEISTFWMSLREEIEIITIQRDLVSWLELSVTEYNPGHLQIITSKLHPDTLHSHLCISNKANLS